MQREKPDEIIVSDNHSIDDSLDVIAEFQHLEIKVLFPSKSLTMSENWNFVARQTKSDWFFLLSNDDLLRNNAVSRLKNIVSTTPQDISVISFRSEIIDEESRLLLGKYKIGRAHIVDKFEYLKRNIRYLHTNAASVAIQKKAWLELGGFPEDYYFLHDLIFYQRANLSGAILESPEIIGRYRVYKNKPNSETRKRLTDLDFVKYEKTDLQRYIHRYPNLEAEYKKELNSNKANTGLRNDLRTKILFLTTLCRRMQEKLHDSGFPG